MIQRNASARAIDLVLAALAFGVSFAVYLRTLAPTIAFLFDDSLEFQLLAQRAAIAHPTGYPLYSLLLVLAARLIPLGDTAYRANLLSAFFAACTVAFMYLAARRLPFGNPLSALLAALIFAFGESYWSQAIIAEVYAFQAFLTAAILWVALALASTTQPIARSRMFTGLCFLVGLSIAHHRMSALNIPALALYILLLDKTIWHRQNLRALIRPLSAFLTPLLLFTYLPLRGITSGSLDGTYQNTLAGFLDWVTGASYTVFLTQNPFNEQRDLAFYFSLFTNELTWLGVGLVLLGLGVLLIAKRARRAGVLLVVGLVANLLFAVNYRVADIDVFFIPTFLYGSLILAVGIGAILYPLTTITQGPDAKKRKWLSGLAIVVILLGGAIPYFLIRSNWEAVRLDDKYDVYDYGRAALTTLPQDATIIGILGEMTRVRYFQETPGLAPNVETIAADKEDARLSAVKNAVKRNRPVFLTRKLSNVEKEFSLSSAGPLIRVQSRDVPPQRPASISHVLNENFDGATLLGYDLDASRLLGSSAWHLDNGRQIQLTLYWRADKKLTNDRLVSIKLLDANGQRAAQLDRHPVLDAYPTLAWRAGEFITDTYDVPIFAGIPAGNYDLIVTLYDPASSQVHGERKLETIKLDADMNHHRASTEALGVDNIVYRNWDGAVLAGYSLDDNEAYGPGDAISLTLVWYLSDTTFHAPLDVQLLDSQGKVVLAESIRLSDFKPVQGEYLQQQVRILIPPDVAAGKFNLRLAESNCLFCEFLPELAPVTLRQIEIKR